MDPETKKIFQMGQRRLGIETGKVGYQGAGPSNNCHLHRCSRLKSPFLELGIRG
jgi:hypothetical protein